MKCTFFFLPSVGLWGNARTNPQGKRATSFQWGPSPITTGLDIMRIPFHRVGKILPHRIKSSEPWCSTHQRVIRCYLRPSIARCIMRPLKVGHSFCTAEIGLCYIIQTTFPLLMPLLSIKSSLQNVLGGVADQIYSDQLFDPGADGPRPRDLNFSFLVRSSLIV